MSETNAGQHAEKLAKLATTDVEEIRRGLPKGGLKLGEVLFTGDTKDIVPTRARSARRGWRILHA